MAIKQHWVPQFYLRGFTTSKNGDSLFVTDILQAYSGGYKDSKERVRDVAQQSHLYSLPLDDGTFHPDRPTSNGWDDGVERRLQTLESEASHIWTHFRHNPEAVDLSPGSNARRTVATFLASLHLRNPRMVAVAKFAVTTSDMPAPLTEQGREEFYRNIAAVPSNLSPTLEGIHDRIAFLAAQFGLLPEISAALTDLHWTVKLFPGNKAAGPLVTSDTPLFCVDGKTMEPTSMASPNCVVFCPLTSRALLIATRATAPTLNGAMVKDTPQGAAAINPFIVHFGQREVYSGFQLGEDFPFLRDAPNTTA